MPIDVVCPSCQKQYRVPEKFSGKAAKCTACGGAIQVPAQPDVRRASDDKLASLFDEEFGDSHEGDRDLKPCPACGKRVALDSMLCVDCGYSFKKRRQVEVKTDGRQESASATSGKEGSTPVQAVAISAAMRQGLRFVGVGLAISLVSTIVGFLGFATVLLLMLGSVATSSEFGAGLSLHFAISVVSIGLLLLLGHALCLWFPTDMEARRSVGVAIGLDVALATSPLWVLLVQRAIPRTAYDSIVFASIVLTVAMLPVLSSVAFLSYLRTLASSMRRTELRAKTKSISTALLKSTTAMAALVFGGFAVQFSGLAAYIPWPIVRQLLYLILVGVLLFFAIRLVVALVQHSKLLIGLRRAGTRAA